VTTIGPVPLHVIGLLGYEASIYALAPRHSS
jgi:hypothetical protein